MQTLNYSLGLLLPTMLSESTNLGGGKKKKASERLMCDTVKKVDEQQDVTGGQRVRVVLASRLLGVSSGSMANLCILSRFPALWIMPVPADRQIDRQTDRQRERQAERQAGSQAGSPLSGAETPGAQWLPWIHSWSLCAALTLYVYCMWACMCVGLF